MKTTLHTLVALLFITAVADAKDLSNRLSPEVARALESPASMKLLSLDPDPRHAHRFTRKFYGYRILGQTDVTDGGSRDRVATAIKTAVRNFDGMVAMCFNPRHGVRVITLKGTTYAFVICYECHSVEIFRGEHALPGSGITGNSASLDELLPAAKVTLAKPLF